MGSSPAQDTCETSQILLADGQVFFLGDLYRRFLPILRLTWLKMSEIILTGCKTK